MELILYGQSFVGDPTGLLALGFEPFNQNDTISVKRAGNLSGTTYTAQLHSWTIISQRVGNVPGYLMVFKLALVFQWPNGGINRSLPFMPWPRS